MRFRDRIDAGHQLAGRLAGHVHGDLVVLGLPRGGVPLAVRVARTLDAPLDVLIVRKLGAPDHREYAVGAIGESGVRVLDAHAVRSVGASEEQLRAVEVEERQELQRRADRYRAGRPPISLVGRTAVIVDDGMATGSTAAAACEIARGMGAASIIVAVPVASADAVDLVRRHADEVISLMIPPQFRSVGGWYEDFSPTSDDEVEELLRSRTPVPPGGATVGSDSVPLVESRV